MGRLPSGIDVWVNRELGCLDIKNHTPAFVNVPWSALESMLGGPPSQDPNHVVVVRPNGRLTFVLLPESLRDYLSSL